MYKIYSKPHTASLQRFTVKLVLILIGALIAQACLPVARVGESHV